MRPKPPVLALIFALIAPSSALAAWSNVPTDNLLVAATSLWDPSTGTGDQDLPILCPDGAGGAIVVWRNMSSGTETPFAQRISSSGTLLWGSGIQIANFPNHLELSQVVSDGEGGAIVLMRTNTNSPDLLVQRLSPNGSRVWPDEGIVVAEKAGAPCIASDGHHGAISLHGALPMTTERHSLRSRSTS